MSNKEDLKVQYELPKTCPQCDSIANNLEGINEKFGFRDMGNGMVIPQSWCRECRKKGKKVNNMTI